MNSITKNGVANSLYFSFASLLTVWIANSLYEFLYQGVGRINIALLVFIVIGIILIMFAVSITNILVKDSLQGEKVSFGQRVLAVIIFIALSLLITGIVGALFFIPF